MSSLRQVLEALEPQFEFENTPDEIRKRFGELQQNISNLRSYVALNYMAVVKIMKKQTKNYPNSDNYDASQLLLSRSFYTSKSLSEVMHRSDKLEVELTLTILYSISQMLCRQTLMVRMCLKRFLREHGFFPTMDPMKLLHCSVA